MGVIEFVNRLIIKSVNFIIVALNWYYYISYYIVLTL